MAAMTLDDLGAIANALRTELSLGIGRIVDAIRTGTPDTPASQSPSLSPRPELPPLPPVPESTSHALSMPSAFDRPIPVIVVGPRPLPVEGTGTGGSGPAPKKPEEKDPSFLEKTTAAFEKIAKSTGTAQAGLMNFISTFEKVIGSLGGGMSRFVQLANPGTVYKFNLAMDNAMSAVGRILVPVMEKFTIIIQQLGNAIESLSPEAKRAAGALAAGGGLAGAVSALAMAGVIAMRALGPVPLIISAVAGALGAVLTSTDGGQKIMHAFGAVMKAVGSLVEVLVRGLLPILEDTFIPALDALSSVLNDAATGVSSLVDALREMVGLSPTNYNPNDKTATATRHAHIGDLRGYANRAYTSAYNSQGSIASQHLKVAQEQTSLLKDMLGALNPLAGAIDGLGKVGGREISAKSAGESFGRWVGGQQGANIGRAVGRAADAAASPFMTIPRLLTRMVAHLE